MMKPRQPWLQAQLGLQSRPIAEGMVDGAIPLYVEHYMLKALERTVEGLSGIAMPVLLGGARVQEDDAGRLRSNTLPSDALLIPRGCATHWRYAGAVEFAIFYFPDRMEGILDRLRLITESRGEPLFVGDTLVSAIAVRVVHELHKGMGADQRYLGMLASLMMEQTYRVLTMPEAGRIDPRHVHFSRLQAVLGYVHEHLGGDVSAPVLAKKAQVSLSHFRRLFQEAMGVPPHSYVLAARLEQARKLLTLTTLPISRIAVECGFSSQSHLTARFHEVHAATPAEYRAHVRRT